MAGYKDYYLLIAPSEQVIKTIKLCKLLTKSYIDDFPSANSKAHISIAHYPKQQPYMIECFIDKLEGEINKFPCIKLQTNNFNFFIHPNDRMTVYAGIKKTNRVDNWIDELKRLIRYNHQLTPHITIAKTIYIDNFYKVWPRFANETYNDSFLVDTIYIMEKDTLNPHARWRLYKKLSFDNQKIID